MRYNKMETFPLSLDGNVENRGQGQEGIISDETYLQSLRDNFRRLWVLNIGQRFPSDADLKIMDLEDCRYVHINTRLRARELFNMYVDVEASYHRTNLRVEEMKRNAPKKHSVHELGSREFTLTYSPKWFDDQTARDKMSLAIERLAKYYDNSIIQLRAVGEVGSNGLSHVHCFYKLKDGKKMTDKSFVRAWPVWNTKKKIGRTGHEGGHHANVRTESDFLGYIDKDIDDAWLEVNIDNRDKQGGV